MSRNQHNGWVREKAGPVGTLLLASVIIGSSIGFAARAHADPGPTIVSYVGNNGETVCRLIDEEPNVPEVETLVEVLHGKGFTYFESGQIIGLSVVTFCPANLPVVQAYVNKYSTASVSPVYRASEKVGGVIQ